MFARSLLFIFQIEVSVAESGVHGNLVKKIAVTETVKSTKYTVPLKHSTALHAMGKKNNPYIVK